MTQTAGVENALGEQGLNVSKRCWEMMNALLKQHPDAQRNWRGRGVMLNAVCEKSTYGKMRTAKTFGEIPAGHKVYEMWVTRKQANGVWAVKVSEYNQRQNTLGAWSYHQPKGRWWGWQSQVATGDAMDESPENIVKRLSVLLTTPRTQIVTEEAVQRAILGDERYEAIAEISSWMPGGDFVPSELTAVRV